MSECDVVTTCVPYVSACMQFSVLKCQIHLKLFSVVLWLCSHAGDSTTLFYELSLDAMGLTRNVQSPPCDKLHPYLYLCSNLFSFLVQLSYLLRSSGKLVHVDALLHNASRKAEEENCYGRHIWMHSRVALASDERGCISSPSRCSTERFEKGCVAYAEHTQEDDLCRHTAEAHEHPVAVVQTHHEAGAIGILHTNTESSGENCV